MLNLPETCALGKTAMVIKSSQQWLTTEDHPTHSHSWIRPISTLTMWLPWYLTWLSYLVAFIKPPFFSLMDILPVAIAWITLSSLFSNASHLSHKNHFFPLLFPSKLKLALNHKNKKWLVFGFEGGCRTRLQCCVCFIPDPCHHISIIRIPEDFSRMWLWGEEYSPG